MLILDSHLCLFPVPPTSHLNFSLPSLLSLLAYPPPISSLPTSSWAPLLYLQIIKLYARHLFTWCFLKEILSMKLDSFIPFMHFISFHQVHFSVVSTITSCILRPTFVMTHFLRTFLYCFNRFLVMITVLSFHFYAVLCDTVLFYSAELHNYDSYTWKHYNHYFSSSKSEWYSLLFSISCVLFVSPVLCVCFLIGLIGNGNSLTGAYGLVGLNLLLPLAVTVLRGMIASLNPLSKYSVLKG